MNHNLLAEFSESEVKEAIFYMKPLGAPGPNEFQAHFYQKHCGTVDKEVCQFMIDALNQRLSLEKINETFITPILKTKHALRIRSFKPISLYNVIYKIISEVLVKKYYP